MPIARSNGFFFSQFFAQLSTILKSATDIFAQINLPNDIFNSKICYRYDYLVIGPRVVQFKVSSCWYRNFKSAPRDYSLNYTPLGPITITNYCNLILLLSLLLFVAVLLFSMLYKNLSVLVCCYCCSPLVYLPWLFCRSVRVLCWTFHFRVVGRPKTDYTNMTARTENLTDFNRYDINYQ